MSPLILLETLEHIAKITLNRPERHNSLVPELLELMLEGLRSIEVDGEIKVVILAANGCSFSTGGDLRGFYEHREHLESYAKRIVGLLNETILAILRLDIPVVTAVNGQVTGGSLGLVLAADIVLVSPSASFTPYYPVVGFSPDGGWTALLPELVGRKRTAEALLTNRTISAEEAVRWGLANRILPADELEVAALEIARTIVSMKPGSVTSARKLLASHLPEVADRLEVEKAQFVQQVSSPEAIQGLAEFLGEVDRG